MASKPQALPIQPVVKAEVVEPSVKDEAKPVPEPQKKAAVKSNAKPQPKQAGGTFEDSPPSLPPTGISIQAVQTSTYKYISFQTHGYVDDTYLFVITPVKTANNLSTYITENSIEEQPATGTSQHGRGNPESIPGASVGDEFTVAVCGEGTYLACGSMVSNKLRLIVVDSYCYEGTPCHLVYEYK